MEDAAGFFANVFGGERFVDYVSPLPCLVLPNIHLVIDRSVKFPS